MEIIFEIFFQIIGEILLQVIFELLIELGIRTATDKFQMKRPTSPFWAAIGYIFMAVCFAAMSLALVPNHVIQRLDLKIANVLISPFIIGWIMSIRGQILRKKDKEPPRIDSFVYGYLFALTFSLLRFFYGH